MKTTAHNRSARLLAQMRAKVVSDMRAAGMTWEQIGKALGVSHQRAQQIGKRTTASDKAAPVPTAEASKALAP